MYLHIPGAEYLEDAIHFTAGSLFYESYGFAGMLVDADACP